ncbi:MAG: cupin domain-containing protein [Hamadaea sp.]|uniref:cupin domain-containing protein n=1 Tax=Hamadaea sp. TaxID=2024425 RepID=UPI00181E4F9F|nr:cupin domain-containing protein [Hamadaea sp.]NUT20605.1 cupin domain-containing protein [Hamadaea sp.]
MTHFVHHSPVGDGVELRAIDAIHTVKIGGKQTGGDYELFEIDAPRGHAIPLHTHAWPEAYYLLYGTLNVQVGEGFYELTPGAALNVPPYAEHTFTIATPSAKFLVFTLTDAMGRFFADLDESIPVDAPMAEVFPLAAAAAARHGVSFVQPPR